MKVRLVGCLGSALAAHALALLAGGLDRVHDLHERWHHGRDLRRLLHQRVRSADGGSQVRLDGAWAASSLGSILAGAGVACWALADKLALWLRAGDWLLALPVALGRLAHWGADGVWCLALGAAVSWGADSLALRAILLLAEILRAANIALWLVAMDLALRTLSLLAVDLALRSFADWVADCWADWVIALPSALWVAISLDFRLESDDGRKGQRGEQQQEEGGLHL